MEKGDVGPIGCLKFVFLKNFFYENKKCEKKIKKNAQILQKNLSQ